MVMDNCNLRLRLRHPQTHQGVCADAIATLEGISRETLDELGYFSQQRADVAIREDRFSRSLIPVYRENGELALARDEYRPHRRRARAWRRANPPSRRSRTCRSTKAARPIAV
jgi:acetyl-CoA C-acetyltransferase